MFKMEEFKDKQYFEYMRKECKSYGMECRNLIHYMRCVYNSTLQDAFYSILSWKIDIMSGEERLNEEGVTGSIILILRPDIRLPVCSEPADSNI